VQPVGSSELFPVDLRIISATNHVLREQVQAGRFREDLYYRIGGLTLELPPLRERTDKRRCSNNCGSNTANRSNGPG